MLYVSVILIFIVLVYAAVWFLRRMLVETVDYSYEIHIDEDGEEIEYVKEKTETKE
jgi:hypothetical protein